KQRFHTITLADFPGDVGREASVGRLAHQGEGLLDLPFGQDIQVGRLLQVHCQGLFEGAVEHSIASGVDEVCDQYSVPGAQSYSLSGMQIKTRADSSQDE